MLMRHRPASLRSVLAVALGLLSGCGASHPAPSSAPQPVVDPAVAAARLALANEATLNVQNIPDRVIAVPALIVNTADSTLAPLGFGLSDMLVTDLARSAQLTIVERTRMNALLREMQLVQSGQVDTSRAPRVGRLLGARRLVVGSLTDRGGGDFGIETRLVNTVDASITGAVSARAPLNSIFDAEKALAYLLFNELGVTLTPAERAAIEQRPTANIVAFLAYSRGVRDEAYGLYASAAVNFQAAVTADPNFGMARTRRDNAQAAQRSVSVSTSEQVAASEAKPAEAKPDETKPAEAKPAEAPKPAEEPKPASTTTPTTTTTTPTATTTTPTTAAPTSPIGGTTPTIGASNPSAPVPVGTGAVTLAGGTINPSPAGAIGTGGGASSTTQQNGQQDRGAQAQKQPIFTTVVINVKQLP